MDRIVVGIDGSQCSREALRFAADEATLRGAQLRVVCAWQVPTMLYPAAGFTAALDPAAFEGYARDSAGEVVGAVLGAGSGIEHELVVRQGNPAHVLLEESAEAAMLVLGSRGHGGFVGLLLGSVSQQCAAHSKAPVVIVHERSS